MNAMQPFFHSLHRDWASWSRIERISALGLFAGGPLAACLAFAVLIA
ncbi:hypothetical protein [Azospirillum soli]|nr:hypothetical protein [Azospirillum soli]MBP2314248.1 hypothetical protein [Azospirillum soli]